MFVRRFFNERADYFEIMTELTDPYPILGLDEPVEDELSHFPGFAFPICEVISAHLRVADVTHEDELFQLCFQLWGAQIRKRFLKIARNFQNLAKFLQF
jgi:hypothetical protein